MRLLSRRGARRGSVIAGIVASLGAALALSPTSLASAGAATTMVTATTTQSAVQDTTSASGGACTAGTNGPVWAQDSYTEQLSAVNTGTNTWRVTIYDNGSFAGFADPANCNAMTSSGSLIGLYSVSVTSTGTPSQANLLSSYSGVPTTQLMQYFFNDPSATVAGGDYFFSYQNGAYVQTTSSSYGDVYPPAGLAQLGWTNVAVQTCYGSQSVLNVLSPASPGELDFKVATEYAGSGCVITATLTNNGVVPIKFTTSGIYPYNGDSISLAQPTTLAAGQSVPVTIVYNQSSSSYGFQLSIVPALAS